MKTLILAAALSLGGVAYAQDTQTTEQPSGETVDDPSQATGPEGVTQQGTDPEGQAVPPPGTTEGVSGSPDAAGPAVPVANPQAAFTPRPATTDYPACSKTVTDSCVQTYEKRRRPR